MGCSVLSVLVIGDEQQILGKQGLLSTEHLVQLPFNSIMSSKVVFLLRKYLYRLILY